MCFSCWWKNWGSISSSSAAQKVDSVLFTYFSFKKGGLFVGSPIMRTQDHIHPSESCWSILCIKTLRNGGCYCCCCRGLWGWCWVCTNRAPSLREHRRLQQRRLLSTQAELADKASLVERCCCSRALFQPHLWGYRPSIPSWRLLDDAFFFSSSLFYAPVSGVQSELSRLHCTALQ